MDSARAAATNHYRFPPFSFWRYRPSLMASASTQHSPSKRSVDPTTSTEFHLPDSAYPYRNTAVVLAARWHTCKVPDSAALYVNFRRRNCQSGSFIILDSVSRKNNETQNVSNIAPGTWKQQESQLSMITCAMHGRVRAFDVFAVRTSQSILHSKLLAKAYLHIKSEIRISVSYT